MKVLFNQINEHGLLSNGIRSGSFEVKVKKSKKFVKAICNNGLHKKKNTHSTSLLIFYGPLKKSNCKTATVLQ